MKRSHIRQNGFAQHGFGFRTSSEDNMRPVASANRAVASGNRPGEGDDDPMGGATVLEGKPKIKKPSMYKVLLLNDDYTPMEFVVHILEQFFGLDEVAATNVMLQVHQQGVGVCGIFTYEVAETKVTQVVDYARQHEHPLQCTLEKD